MPPASSVSPAPMSLFSPNRLSTPTIRKFSSPNCALGSTMSRESGSSAETLLSMLFFDDCHCHAPPVSASADTAIRAAAARPAIIVLRASAPRGSGLPALRPVPTRDGCTRLAPGQAARSGTSDAYPATTGMTSVSGSPGSTGTAAMTSVGGAGGTGRVPVRGGAASVPWERPKRRAPWRSGRRRSHRRCGYRSAAAFSPSPDSEMPCAPTARRLAKAAHFG